MFKITVVGCRIAIVLLGCWLTTNTVAAVAADASEIKLEVGIIQRLGFRASDERQPKSEKVTIRSTPGDSLTVDFPQAQTVGSIETKEVKITIEPQPLTEPLLSERLVLSDRATFETAEASAEAWRKLGIEVEIVQPGRWQVWAKRDVYSTPLIRRWLLQSLQTNGYDEAYLATEVLTRQPRATLTIADRQYQQDEVNITSQKNLVEVKLGNGDTSLYGGSLELQSNAFGEYTIVNHVPLETYLRGVVPHEIGANAPAQAVAAQTIIARTYALRNLRRFADDGYQLCATVHCQVYKGLSATNSKSDRAIEATKGLVLTYQNELVDALYSSTTGGVTASFDDIWNGADRPYLQAIIDSPRQLWDLSAYPLADETNLRRFLNLKQGFNETGRRVFRWNKTSSIKDLNRDLRHYLTKTRHPLADFGTIHWMKVEERSPSGRILILTIQTDKGKLQLHKNEVRSAFEAPISTLFYLEPVYDRKEQLKAYNFIGGGFGHGVGLSQYGSYNLANLGWTAAQILSFYYPQTTIQPLNDSIVFWRDPFFDLSTSNR